MKAIGKSVYEMISWICPMPLSTKRGEPQAFNLTSLCSRKLNLNFLHRLMISLVPKLSQLCWCRPQEPSVVNFVEPIASMNSDTTRKLPLYDDRFSTCKFLGG